MSFSTFSASTGSEALEGGLQLGDRRLGRVQQRGETLGQGSGVGQAAFGASHDRVGTTYDRIGRGPGLLDPLDERVGPLEQALGLVEQRKHPGRRGQHRLHRIGSALEQADHVTRAGHRELHLLNLADPAPPLSAT
jgi:hypothetical protein